MTLALTTRLFCMCPHWHKLMAQRGNDPNLPYFAWFALFFVANLRVGVATWQHALGASQAIALRALVQRDVITGAATTDGALRRDQDKRVASGTIGGGGLGGGAQSLLLPLPMDLVQRLTRLPRDKEIMQGIDLARVVVDADDVHSRQESATDIATRTRPGNDHPGAGFAEVLEKPVAKVLRLLCRVDFLPVGGSGLGRATRVLNEVVPVQGIEVEIVEGLGGRSGTFGNDHHFDR